MLASRRVDALAQPQRIVDPCRDLGHAEHAHTRRSEFDGEWQSIEPGADLTDRTGVLLVESELGIREQRTLPEQLRRLTISEYAGIRLSRDRQRQRRHGQDLLTRQGQALATRRQEIESLDALQSLARERTGAADQVLTVIEDQEVDAASQSLQQCVHESAPGLFRTTQSGQRGLRDMPLVTHLREFDVDDAASGIDPASCQLEREPTLPRFLPDRPG